MKRALIRRTIIAGLLSGLILAGLASDAHAIHTYWDLSPPASGDWGTGGNWDAGEPTSSDYAYIDNGGTANVTSSGEEAYHLYLGYLDGASGNVEMTAGDLSTTHETIGYVGTGVFTQSGGANTLSGYLNIGEAFTGVGTYNLSGTGSLSAEGEVIGFYGTGDFTQTGGTNTVSYELTLGDQSGGSGTYDLSGTGSLSAEMEIIGDLGTGVFYQSGGTNTTTHTLSLGEQSTGSGTYDLSGGEISTYREYVGNSGTGDFTQSAGANVINYSVSILDSGTLFLGSQAGAIGTYDLSGGELVARFGVIGGEGTGTFTQSGGTSSITDDLILGKTKTASATGTGTYNLGGTGSLSASYEVIGYEGEGAFVQTGGTNTVSDQIKLGEQSTGSGTYDLGGGSLSADNEHVGFEGTGGFTQTGGTNTVSTGLYLATLSTGSGTYDLSGTGSLSSLNEYIGVAGTGDFTQSGGTNTVTYGFAVGNLSAGTGTYGQGGGSLSASYEIIGNYGTGTFTQSGGTNTINYDAAITDSGKLFVGHQSGGTGAYNLSGTGSLSASYEVIGNYGTGTFTQTGGTNTINYDAAITDSGKLFVGHESTGNGAYELSGGGLSADMEYIGASGTGTFTQSGGTNALTNYLYLGDQSGGSGTYILSGTGSLSAIHEHIGAWGTGDFNQTGGTNTISSHLLVGWTPTGSGSYDLSGTGSLSAYTEVIGDLGTGDFTQSGGTNSITNDLVIGKTKTDSATGAGTYNLSGTGSLSAKNEYIGYEGDGVFTHSGGTNTVSSGLYLGHQPSGDGTYNLSGGELSAGSEDLGYLGTGAFTHTGGTNTVAGTLILGDSWMGTGSGTYDLSGTGSLSAGGELIGNYQTGAFTQSGGTNTAGSLRLGNQSTGSGTYNLDGGDLTAVNEYIGYEGDGAFTQTAGNNTISADLTLGAIAIWTGPGTFDLSGGTYDLINGSLSADYEYIGDGGTGVFTQSGGTNTIANNLYLGFKNTGTGAYNLSGMGSLSAYDEYIGNNGTGDFTQSGGTNTVSHTLSVRGTYALSGGDLSASTEFIGTHDTSVFTQTGGTNTINYNASFGAPGRLELGYTSTGDGAYDLSGTGSLSAYVEIIGNLGTGAFTQSGGTNSMDRSSFIANSGTLYLGRGSTGIGSYELGGGDLSAVSEYIGDEGTGAFTQTGGTNDASVHHSSSGFYMGKESTGTGTYYMSGGTLRTHKEIIGDYGTGTFTQTGGTNIISHSYYVPDTAYLYLGRQSTGEGTYNLSGTGNLVTYGEYIGLYGTGTFTQTGGTHTVRSFVTGVGGFYLGEESGASGTYNLSGGNLSAEDEIIGKYGSGTFTQTGGTNTVKNTLSVGGISWSDGTYDLSGGTLTAGSIKNNSIFNYSGGDLNVISGDFTNYGTFTLSGSGTRTVNGNVTNRRTIMATNTTADFTGSFTNRGTYTSDSSDNYFDDLTFTLDGKFIGGAGDRFFVREDFENQSIVKYNWDTVSSYLGFVTGTDGLHDLDIPGADVGQASAGYTDNFAWGVLELASGNSISLFDGNSGNSGTGLYVGEALGLVTWSSFITNITGSSGLNVYYDEALAGNAYLGGLAYYLTGGGKLVPLYGSPDPLPPPAVLNSDFGTGDSWGWDLSVPGAGSAAVVEYPSGSGDYALEMTAVDPVTVSQDIDTPSIPFYVMFDYMFTTTTGHLDVLLNSVLLETIFATDPLVGDFTSYDLLVSDPALLGLTDVPLAFSLYPGSDSQLYLDDVGTVPTPEPATLFLLGTGLVGLGLVRRRKSA